MAKPRVTATDQLANVIEVVELGRRTGLLSVERGVGLDSEEGEIYFVGGRAIYAALPGIQGRDALAIMSRWGTCRFSFDRDEPRPAPNIAPATPSSASSPSLSGARALPPDFTTSQPGYMPSPARENTGPFTAAPRISDPAFGFSGSHPSGILSGLNGDPWTRSMPGGPPLPQNQDTPQLQRRPRRAPDVRDLMKVVTTYNLSRGHRTILLLADGEHTIHDVSRLSSKPIQEVLMLLNDLESRGLIYYY